MQNLSSLLKMFSGKLHFGLLDLPNYWSDTCRRYNLEGVRWCVDGDQGS